MCSINAARLVLQTFVCYVKPARFHAQYTSPQIPIIISTTSLIMLIAFWWRGFPILCASALSASSRLKSSTIHSPASKAMLASTESATPINCGKNAMKNKISFGLLRARNSPCVKHLRALSETMRGRGLC